MGLTVEPAAAGKGGDRKDELWEGRGAGVGGAAGPGPGKRRGPSLPRASLHYCCGGTFLLSGPASFAPPLGTLLCLRLLLSRFQQSLLT